MRQQSCARAGPTGAELQHELSSEGDGAAGIVILWATQADNDQLIYRIV
jgi:hypothetical protein